MMSIKPDASTQITLKPRDGNYLNVDASQVRASLADKSNTRYTWALLPTRIDDKDMAVSFLESQFMAPHHDYFWKDIEPVLNILVAVNQLIRTEGEFEFHEYGDFFLYAMLRVEDFSPYYLYVFCTDHNVPIANKIQFLFDGVDVNDWQSKDGGGGMNDEEKRQAVCLHCGHVNEKESRVLEDKDEIGFGLVHREIRNLYRCANCHKEYEYYWMWRNGKIVIEETVKIEWRTNPYFKPDAEYNSERFYEFRKVERVHVD